jgi:DHA3 family multidrug efflux protein-like MFS transporter
MKSFYQLLGNALIVSIKNNFVWFALTYWVYLSTKSVISTSIVGGTFLVISALSNFWFGAIVDNHKKKYAMLLSGAATFVFFILGFVILNIYPAGAFNRVDSPVLWIFVTVLLIGTMFGSIYAIAIPTLVSVLVPKDGHDKANGMFGTVMGISFAVTSVASGIVLGNFGMGWVLVISIILTIVSLIHLLTIQIPEKTIIHVEGQKRSGVDIKGTIKAVAKIPGLFALIFFTTLNNLLGGVFMSLMDAYGLTMVSVQEWGTLWGFLSLGFIFGGIYISKYGLGKDPLKNLFRINMVIWAACIIFPIQHSVILLSIGSLVWMIFIPFIEATEQTIIQKVVPVERQGRVFGFAHTVEQSASPLTAFLIGPLAQFVFIPFMTTGRGVSLIGSWFGVGEGRGMALVFIAAGFVGLIIALLATRSESYKLLSNRFAEVS